MVRNIKEEHYFTRTPTSKLKEREIIAEARGVKVELITGSGTFSPKKIDTGTKLLIEKAIIKKNQKILDLGCGYGMVGILLGKAEPTLKILMTDINERAVMLAEKNAEKNNVKAEAKQSDIFENISEKFDVILLNPPQTAGKDICFKMIEGSKKYLNEEGSLQIVARHQKGGKTLQAKMEETFGNVEVIGKGSGYRIYYSELEKSE